MRRDRGFTLIEVLVVVIILSVVGVVFASAATQGFAVTTRVARSLDDSASRAVLVSRITADLRGAAHVGASAGPDCDAPAGSSRVLWAEEPDGSVVVYLTGATGTRTVLSRMTCAGGSASEPLPLAQWDSAAAVQVTCDSGPVCSTTGDLAGPVAANEDTLDLEDAAALPATGPYDLTVEDERMTVTDGFGTDRLTVYRAAPAAHAAGEARYEPSTVTVVVPLSDPGLSVTVARRAS